MENRAGHFLYNLFSDKGNKIIDCDTLRQLSIDKLKAMFNYLFDTDSIDFEQDNYALQTLFNINDVLNEIEPVEMTKTVKESLKELYENYLGIPYEN